MSILKLPNLECLFRCIKNTIRIYFAAIEDRFRLIFSTNRSHEITKNKLRRKTVKINLLKNNVSLPTHSPINHCYHPSRPLSAGRGNWQKHPPKCLETGPTLVIAR